MYSLTKNIDWLTETKMTLSSEEKKSFSYIAVAWLLNKNDTGSNFSQVHLQRTKKIIQNTAVFNFSKIWVIIMHFGIKKLVHVSLSCVKLFNKDNRFNFVGRKAVKVVF